MYFFLKIFTLIEHKISTSRIFFDVFETLKLIILNFPKTNKSGYT
jgi:hypothetical protein